MIMNKPFRYGKIYFIKILDNKKKSQLIRAKL
jgi:hypothetical protein